MHLNEFAHIIPCQRPQSLATKTFKDFQGLVKNHGTIFKDLFINVVMKRNVVRSIIKCVKLYLREHPTSLVQRNNYTLNMFKHQGLFNVCLTIRIYELVRDFGDFRGIQGSSRFSRTGENPAMNKTWYDYSCSVSRINALSQL